METGSFKKVLHKFRIPSQRRKERRRYAHLEPKIHSESNPTVEKRIFLLFDVLIPKIRITYQNCLLFQKKMENQCYINSMKK